MAAARSRPRLAAAAMYAALALVFVGPALVPGRTLSNSDCATSTCRGRRDRPAEPARPVAARGGARLGRGLRPLAALQPSGVPRDSALEPARDDRSPVPRERVAGCVLAFHGADLRAPLRFRTRPDGGAEALRGRARDLPTRPRRSASAGPGRSSAGLVFAFGMPLVTWLMETNVSAVWCADSVAAAGDVGGRHAAGRCCRYAL